jgi:hypothetical protein
VLGLTVDGLRREVRLSDPILPEWLTEVRINKLAVPGGSVDLLFERHPHDVGVTILRRDPGVRVTVMK